MSKTKRRERAVRRAMNVRSMPAVRALLAKCLNCGEPGPHLVPPSLGDPAFYICTAKSEVSDD